mmetsp:Transcript_14815/g.21767  ORF Transcript_14815/g.21767 Transcript_14815/m.21767 type:complete len:136 (-) Transcript_14815:508-915(-)
MSLDTCNKKIVFPAVTTCRCLSGFSRNGSAHAIWLYIYFFPSFTYIQFFFVNHYILFYVKNYTHNPPDSLFMRWTKHHVPFFSLRNSQKETPGGKVTESAHPARFSPDDKFSRHRIACKKRFGIYLPDSPLPKPM